MFWIVLHYLACLFIFCTLTTVTLHVLTRWNQSLLPGSTALALTETFYRFSVNKLGYLPVLSGPPALLYQLTRNTVTPAASINKDTTVLVFQTFPFLCKGIVLLTWMFDIRSSGFMYYWSQEFHQNILLFLVVHCIEHWWFFIFFFPQIILDNDQIWYAKFTQAGCN